jgi:two-component system, NarL family, sensor histidine kinase DegS
MTEHPSPDGPEPDPPAIAARVTADADAPERELAEIDMLVGQAKAEAGRHEAKRAQASEKLAAPSGTSDAKAVADAYAQLVTLTRRAVLMDAQVEVLEGKRKALARHRDALRSLAEALEHGMPPEAEAQAGEPAGAGDDGGGAMPPSLSRVVLAAQEDLRREIARSLHDGPAQSLTNIVLQSQILERILERDPSQAKAELRLLAAMVQQTLDATKNFIFDVRPMVLDDLGLVPTLRRATRDRGRRAHVPVEFDSLGQDRRLPMEVESTLFRILDEALGAYLAQGPELVTVRLDWTDTLEATVRATRTAVAPPADEMIPESPSPDEVPAALVQMIEDRRVTRAAADEAARVAALVTLPSAVRREIADRAATIGTELELLDEGSQLRIVVPLDVADEPGPEA